MLIKKKYRVPEDHEVLVRIPENVPTDKEIEIMVVIKDGKERNALIRKKLEELKESINDPIFNEDIKEISKDFKHVDVENLQ